MKCQYCFEEFKSIDGLMAHQENCFHKENPLKEPIKNDEVQEEIKKPVKKSRKKS